YHSSRSLLSRFDVSAGERCGLTMCQTTNAPISANGASSDAIMSAPVQIYDEAAEQQQAQDNELSEGTHCATSKCSSWVPDSQSIRSCSAMHRAWRSCCRVHTP